MTDFEFPPPPNAAVRHFGTYSGTALPLRLVGPIDAGALANRNTYIRAYYNAAEDLLGFDKIVYGAVELSHRYAYHPSGRLKRADIVMLDEEPAWLDFDDDGAAPPV